MRLQGHRSPWDARDTATLYRLIRAGLMQEQIAERLGRTSRAVRWKVGEDRRKSLRATIDHAPAGFRQPPFDAGHKTLKEIERYTAAAEQPKLARNAMDALTKRGE